jgi:hypothetical protein
VPPEALAELPLAWIARVRAGVFYLPYLALCRSRHRRRDCRHGANRQLARTAAERASVWLRTNALRQQRAASRGWRSLARR